MFSLQHDCFDIAFTFQHIKDIEGDVGIKAATYCTLRINGQEFNSVAACSSKDQFNKDKGRKIALARALKVAREKLTLPRTLREVIWYRYFTRQMCNAEFQQTIEEANG